MLSSQKFDSVLTGDSSLSSRPMNRIMDPLKLMGANVNLGNISPFEVISLECLRLGLRGDTFFDNLPNHLIKKVKI